MDNIDHSKIYSASKILRFENCPQDYYFYYLDSIYSEMRKKLQKNPENIFPFYTLGRAIHNAITLFFYLDKEERTINSLKNQLKITWKSEVMPNIKLVPGKGLGKWGGFITIEQERKYYQYALEMLENFYNTFPKEQKIRYLPTSNIKNSYDDYKNLIKKINDEFQISGKIDIVLEIDGDRLEVIDFKTGKEDGNKNNFQLKFYKILTELNFGKPVSKASFYYLKSGNIKEFDLTKEDTDKIRDLILNKIEKITREKEFITKPKGLCKFCLFRNFCPAKKEIAQFIEKPVQEEIIEDLPF